MQESPGHASYSTYNSCIKSEVNRLISSSHISKPDLSTQTLQRHTQPAGTQFLQIDFYSMNICALLLSTEKPF